MKVNDKILLQNELIRQKITISLTISLKKSTLFSTIVAKFKLKQEQNNIKAMIFSTTAEFSLFILLCFSLTLTLSNFK